MPGLRRIDPEIRFAVRGGQPAWPNGPSELLSVRWRGILKAAETGPYQFQAWCADGLRLFVDNSEVLANWSPRKVGLETGIAFLEQGYHLFVLESFCSGGQGGVFFSFKKSNDSGEATAGTANFFHDPSKFAPL